MSQLDTNFGKRLFSFLKTVYLFSSRRVLGEAVGFRLNTKINRLVNKARHGAVAYPYQVIYVESNDIKRKVHDVRLFEGLGQVKGGDWDRENLKPVDDTFIVEGLKERYVEEKTWEDTVYYDFAKETYEEGGSIFECEDLETFEQTRLKYNDQLFEKISREGYRRNSPEQHNSSGDISAENPHTRIQHQLEVLVAIGRHGEVFFIDGHHRLGMAQILNLEIPVHVVCRHEEWQRLRDRVHSTDSEKLDSEVADRDVLNHPDLTGLV